MEKVLNYEQEGLGTMLTGLYVLVGDPFEGKTTLRELTKEILKNAELGRKRKDREEWAALVEKIGEQKTGQEALRRLADLFGSYWARWKKLESIAPEAVYKEWWRENHDKPIEEALNRLELKVRGKKCRGKDRCDNVFIPKRTDQVYCSERCRDREVKRRYRLRKKELLSVK